MVKKTYDFDLLNLRQKPQSQEVENNTLQAELERIKARSQELESELSSQQNEASFWKNKCQDQAELISTADARIRKLDLGLSKAQADASASWVQYTELKDKYKGLEVEHITQGNYILDLQSSVAQGIEESNQLQKDLKKVQETLATVQ